ncbi:MAG: N-acetylmuramoyl-L-alanine amidase [bacterium]
MLETRRPLWTVLAVLFWILAGLAAPAHAAKQRLQALVEQVGWEVGATGAHVVVTVKGQVDYSSHTASADSARGLPPRAYVDLTPARLGTAIERTPIAVEDGLVRRIRIGQFDQNTVRIVVDLRGPALFEVQTAVRPARLILSLRLPPRPSPGLRRRAAAATPALAPQAGGGVAKAESEAKAASPPVAIRDRRFRVVIDPGHGGRDPGARGVAKEAEKTVTLRVAELVAAKLAHDDRIEVILTRSDDRSVSLEERTGIANVRAADLFVSIHANASTDGKARGIETYTLNNTDDKATTRLAALENGLELTGMRKQEGDLAFILSDLLQKGKEQESKELARAVQEETTRHVGSRWKGVDSLGTKTGPFFVLVGAYMPCILIEVGFLTHPLEGHRLSTRRYQNDLAEGITRGIRRFLRASSGTGRLENL